MSIPGYRDLIRLAIPVILANAAVPLLGLADTAVIGRTGDAAALGAIALGALIFSFLYWGFGFLRMGTTGFTAQAAGAGDWPEVRAAFARALLLGLGIGVLLILLQWPLGLAALALLNGSESVELGVQQYFHVRIWGAPATLGLFALLGTLIGLGHTRQLLWLQLFLNGLNVLLDVLFVAGFGWGVRGIALGTVIAEWTSLLLGLWMVVQLIRPQDDAPLWPWQRIVVREHWLRTLRANADIMWRTLMLLAGFAWFTDQGARFGDVTLAANHILLQFVSLSAFFLDGYAFVVESQVGRAMGARQALWFRLVIQRSTILAAGTAVALALLVWWPGPLFIDALTTVASVREAARLYLPWAALYVLCSFVAFQLDGIFIGTTESRPMRNATAMALGVFLLAAAWLVPHYANHGLWLAFVLFVIARGITLGAYLPALHHRIREVV